MAGSFEGEAKNVFSKVFRLVSAEVSSTRFLHIILYTVSRISLYVNVYIENMRF